MKALLAKYVLCLRDAASRTHRTEDRPLYEKYLADAAVLLALVEVGAPQEQIREAAENHERLWGQTWLIDDAYKEPSSAWQTAKQGLL